MRPHALRVAVHAGALWSRCMPGRGEGSSRAMLATARPSCFTICVTHNQSDQSQYLSYTKSVVVCTVHLQR